MGLIDALSRIREQKIRGGYQIGNSLHSLAQQVEQKKMADLGYQFVQQGDYTPEGIQKFAESHKVSMPTMIGLVKMAKAFQDYKTSQQPERGKVVSLSPGAKAVNTMTGETVATNPKPQETKAMVDVPGYGKMPANVGYHYLKKNDNPSFSYQKGQNGNFWALSRDGKQKIDTGIKFFQPSKEGAESKQLINQYNFLVKSIVPADKTMILTEQGLADMINGGQAKSIYDKLSDIANKGGPKGMRAKQALELFNKVVGPLEEAPEPVKPIKESWKDYQ